MVWNEEEKENQYKSAIKRKKQFERSCKPVHRCVVDISNFIILCSPRVCTCHGALTLPTHAHASELGYILANLSRFICCKVNTNSL